MMTVLRRWLGLQLTDKQAEEAERTQERKNQYERIQSGLHEASQRVHFLEIEEELRARRFRREEKHR